MTQIDDLIGRLNAASRTIPVSKIAERAKVDRGTVLRVRKGSMNPSMRVFERLMSAMHAFGIESQPKARAKRKTVG